MNALPAGVALLWNSPRSSRARGKLVAEETEKWAKVIRAANIRVESPSFRESPSPTCTSSCVRLKVHVISHGKVCCGSFASIQLALVRVRKTSDRVGADGRGSPGQLFCRERVDQGGPRALAAECRIPHSITATNVGQTDIGSRMIENTVTAAGS
jgi:hypothetical protein